MARIALIARSTRELISVGCIYVGRYGNADRRVAEYRVDVQVRDTFVLKVTPQPSLNMQGDVIVEVVYHRKVRGI